MEKEECENLHFLEKYELILRVFAYLSKKNAYLVQLILIKTQVLKEERQNFILDELRIHRKVLTSELSLTLEVSEDTIRRDLKDLSDVGKVKKVHGGAVVPSLHPYSFHEREVFALERKIELASKALSLIHPGDVIIMDGGTTNLELAKRLPPGLSVTVFTNSLPIAVALIEHVGVEVIFAGGKLLKAEKVTTGGEAIEVFANVQADLGILGTRCIHHDVGITENNWEEAKVKRAIVNASSRIVSMVIEEKMETLTPYKVAAINQIDTLVVDMPVDHELLIPYRKAGISII